MPDAPHTTPAERYLLALLEDGADWGPCQKGIYESIAAGYMTCDETGRGFSLTPDGRHYVESRPDLMNVVLEMARRAREGGNA